MNLKARRILHILPALNFCGGIESYVMNYYRHVNKQELQFDFITHTNLECSFEQEITAFGGRIYKFPIFSIKNICKIVNLIDKFFLGHKGEYLAIHCHMANAACFYFAIARKHGMTRLILHSHNSASSGLFTHCIRNYFLLKLGNMLATDRLACTSLAGKFLFGSHKYSVIHNAIEIGRFQYNPWVRDELRKQNSWNNKIIIGHVGRMAPQKNQKFLLEIFKRLKDMNNMYHLVMIGQGEDENAIRDKIHKLELENSVSILPPVNDVWRYYQAFDGFVFPSFYEGLGIVLVEAQCAGLPVFASSDKIPTDVNMSKNFHFISLNKTDIEWAKIVEANINVDRNFNIQTIVEAGYDISREADKLKRYYFDGCF